MREARLIFPIQTDNPTPTFNAIDALIAEFSGVTTTRGQGHWRNPLGIIELEFVDIIDVAYEPDPINDATLYEIAWGYLVAAKQQEVYVRYGNGHVQMVKEMSCMDNGELLLVSFDYETMRTELHLPSDNLNDVIEHAEHVSHEHVHNL